MSKLPPPMNLEGMNLEAIHEAIQDCHDWPGRNHPDDTYHLGMRAVCTAMRLESALESARAEIAAKDAEIAGLKRVGVVLPQPTENQTRSIERLKYALRVGINEDRTVKAVFRRQSCRNVLAWIEASESICAHLLQKAIAS